MPDYYRDPTHIDIENWVDMDKVDEIHKQLARWLREKMYGLDVREALARLVEQTSSDLFDANQVALALEQLAITLEEKWNEEYQSLTDEWKNTLAGVTVDDEVINARIELRGFVYKTLKERLDAMQAISDKLNPVSEVFSIEHNQNCYPVVRVLAFENGLGIGPLGVNLGGSNTITVNCDTEYMGRNSLKVKVPLAFAMTNPTTERISPNEYLLVEGIKSLIIEVGTKAEANVETFITKEIESDFTGKIRGSIVENGNIARRYAGTAIPPSPPTGYEYGTQAAYDAIKKLEGTLSTQSTNTGVNASIPWHVLGFNVLWILEQIFPSIFKNAPTLAEKVGVAKKAYILNTCSLWVKGSGPSGNLATVRTLNANGIWVDLTNGENTTNEIKRITSSSNDSNRITADGHLYSIVFAEASSETVYSSASIDYASITITARVPFSKI